MMIVYGSHRCPDCEAAQRMLREKGIAYEYADITGSLKSLKEFLTLRDSRPELAGTREAGGIGIPCFYCPDTDRVALDFEEL